jgi:hypothetical protein
MPVTPCVTLKKSGLYQGEEIQAGRTNLSSLAPSGTLHPNTCVQFTKVHGSDLTDRPSSIRFGSI